jgi:hypothetical protein
MGTPPEISDGGIVRCDVDNRQQRCKFFDRTAASMDTVVVEL